MNGTVHRPLELADAVREPILEANRAGFCADVVVDPGYTLMRAETFHLPLQQAKIPLTLRPASHQKGESQGVSGMKVIDGQLFSEHTPEEFCRLEMPGIGSTSAERIEAAEQFKIRATWRYSRHSWNADGSTRWKCAFCAGRLRSRAVPKSMRGKGPSSRSQQERCAATGSSRSAQTSCP